jgi:hypothetical protein
MILEHEALCGEVEEAVEFALRGKFTLDTYERLQHNNSARSVAEAFIESRTAANINSIILDLEEYVDGGNKKLRETYGHLSFTEATKIKEYLYGLLEGAWRFSHERRRTRRRSSATHK